MAVSVIVLYNCEGLAFSSRKAKMFRKVLWLIPGVDSFSFVLWTIVRVRFVVTDVLISLFYVSCK